MKKILKTLLFIGATISLYELGRFVTGFIIFKQMRDNLQPPNDFYKELGFNEEASDKEVQKTLSEVSDIFNSFLKDIDEGSSK